MVVGAINADGLAWNGEAGGAYGAHDVEVVLRPPLGNPSVLRTYATIFLELGSGSYCYR